MLALFFSKKNVHAQHLISIIGTKRSIDLDQICHFEMTIFWQDSALLTFQSYLSSQFFVFFAFGTTQRRVTQTLVSGILVRAA